MFIRYIILKKIKYLCDLLHVHVCDITYKTIFQMCSFTHRLKSLREFDFYEILAKYSIAAVHWRKMSHHTLPTLTWALLDSNLSVDLSVR